MTKHIGIAAVGNVLDVNCWGGSPKYFYDIGNELGFFDEPWVLNLNEFKIPRVLWNLKQYTSLKGMGGYQYSEQFLSLAESKIPKSYFGSTVITFNQLFPRAATIKKSGGKIYYFVDTTLFHLFNEPEYEINIPSSVKIKALEQEKVNYQKADAIITMGHWIQDSLFDFYGIPKEKVFQILPGTNLELPNDFKYKSYKEGVGKQIDLVLGFVGKDWKRKGLLFLLDVQQELRIRGYKVIIKAIGNCPKELKNTEGLDYVGFVDKQKDMKKFIDVISSCDLGCLFSSSEALGISTLEFLRVGVPVTGFFHQGLRDTLLEGASLPFDLSSSVTYVADSLQKVIDNGGLKILKKNAENYAQTQTWEQVVYKIKDLIDK